MAIELDHFIVPTHDQVASARMLAELLDVPWSETAPGPFSPVFINDGLTLDFLNTEEAFPVHHYCFRVSQPGFDAILARIKERNIAYRSSVRGPSDSKINTEYGGSMIYWNEPAGHQWEMLTVSYARQR
ncbi:VOC family protein [Pseudoduganella sp. LjRoot289]|uniref:VOC family protein n=1 Tax=Pseudoduganella sp. LjRoot289 TaxID=3342314 RepID=UPI003ECD7C01